MTHHKQFKHLRRSFKRLAMAFAGAALMSTALLPGIPTATVHASPAPQTTKAAIPQKANVKQKKSSLKTENTDALHHNKQNTGQDTTTKDSNKKVLDITATAYAPGPHDNDQWGDKTYLGTDIRPGVIAVDPNVIPLGSRVKIEYPDGSSHYAIAEDTGGAIKGHRIDIAKPSVNEAKDFGMQKVKVSIVEEGNKS